MNKKRFFYIEAIRKNKSILKKNKFNIKKIEENINTYDNMNIYTFSALCFIFKYNFTLVNNKLCYNLKKFDSPLKFIIKQNNIYYLYVGNDIENIIKHTIENKVLITNISKPLKSISTYKIKELRELGNKLQINIDKKNKKDLYSEIKYYFE